MAEQDWDPVIRPKREFEIKKLSSHLFWDVDTDKLNSENNKKFIIGRVLNYGVISDWDYIKNYYGVEIICNIAVTIKDLDPKSVSLISLLSNVPKEQFKCYATIQSQPKHWNF
jgi:hypothetical protein